MMPRVRIYIDGKFPTYFLDTSWDYDSDEIELTDEEFNKIEEANRIYAEAQQFLAEKVKGLSRK